MEKKVEKPRAVRMRTRKCERLAFMVDFMTALHISIPVIAEKTNRTRQAVAHRFRRDDCQLSDVHDMLNAFGYKLDISLTKIQQKERIDTKTTIIIGKDNGGYLDESKRLYFLRKAMSNLQITIQDLSEKLNCYTSTIGYWFKTDDMPISKIYNIANAFRMKINFTISPMDEEAQ